MTDPFDDIQFVVFDGREVFWELRAWLGDRPHVWHASETIGEQYTTPIWQQRNTMLQRFLQSSDRPWLAMLDDDMSPDDDTRPLWESDYPIASAHCADHAGRPVHDEDGQFCCGACKISRAALERIEADPFGPPLPGQCECNTFRYAARRASYWPRKAGACAHVMIAALKLREDGTRIRLIRPEAGYETKHTAQGN